MKKLLKTVFAFCLIYLVSQFQVLAQCAMCRASVENNVSNGETTVGAALNMGILYLFAAPYLLALIIGILWYRHSKKNKKSIA
ncbi:hypothetical protein QWY93_10530 [Echinicola jeungdonensis]|uniref:Uncharacterized protein n=1 Tax=Echinicola jeungdonensis TaxID=709343 RepID=A0ABV5J7G8_9BACT|nr:hypothetical protein [Echinicola jeungdonensis]MDN3669758.1 hypothetical protein [Echinicola jeungdonensis]